MRRVGHRSGDAVRLSPSCAVGGWLCDINELLHTPTAAPLLDRGFISFDDNGDVLVSPVADVVSLRRMGLDPRSPPRPLAFNTDQRHFLAHYRKEVFLAAEEGLEVWTGK